MTTPFSRIRAAAVDGRLCNVYWRQGQLENLHAALISHSHEIRDAIRQDTGNTASEARIEYLLALSAIKELYSSLDPAKELRDEYSTANGIDSPLARQPAGLAYIDPASYSMFYSVLSPLAAAIAAGNCVIVRVNFTLMSMTTRTKTR
jgi:acyl-CoA reductase-like NAD-dependent aldehyde dehydrogenase